MKVLIGGGTGFIGRHLKKSLLGHGHTVQIISRTPAKDCITWKDLESENNLPGCDVVVNLSGEYILNFFRQWDDSYKRDVYESRIGTNNLLVKLITEGSNKPKVWLSSHAEGYYPRGFDKIYDENFILDTTPTNYSQKLCIEWENSAKLPTNSITRHVGIRLGVVLGKDGGLIQQSWLPFSLGLGGTVGSGKQYMPWVHIKDVTDLFIHAIENNDVTGVLNAISPGTCTINEFTKAFGKAMQRPTVFGVPEFMIKFVAGRDRAPFMLEGSIIKPNRTVDSGFNFRFTDINHAMEDITRT